MADAILTAAKTGQIITVRFSKSVLTVVSALTGLLYNSTNLTCTYYTSNDTSVHTVTLQNMTLGTYASAGFKELDAANAPGAYQFGVPTAAIPTGAMQTFIKFKGFLNMIETEIVIALTAVDFQNATTGGLGNLDATVSTRLAAGGYTAPDNAGITALGSSLSTVNTNVLNRLASSAYVAPDNASISTIATAAGAAATSLSAITTNLATANAGITSVITGIGANASAIVSLGGDIAGVSDKIPSDFANATITGGRIKATPLVVGELPLAVVKITSRTSSPQNPDGSSDYQVNYSVKVGDAEPYNTALNITSDSDASIINSVSSFGIAPFDPYSDNDKLLGYVFNKALVEGPVTDMGTLVGRSFAISNFQIEEIAS